MTDLLFQTTGFTSNRTDLPVTQNITDILTTTKYELDSYGHWVFYDENPLVDKVNAHTLTLQSGAAIQPVYSNAGVELTNAKGSALMSSLVDAAATNITAVFVVKTSGTALSLFGMTLPTTGSTTDNGFGPYASADKVYLNMKPLIASSVGNISGLTTNKNISQTTPFLVAVSVDKTNRTAMLYTFKAGTDAFVSSAFTAPYDDSSKVLAVGNAYYKQVENGARTTFAEAILYNKALSLNELKAVALRCRARLALKNILI